jgi:hypothetical protein
METPFEADQDKEFEDFIVKALREAQETKGEL